jgi:ribosomal protein S18 acetylase RimI-like enzyme
MIRKPWVKLKEFINREDYDTIDALRVKCFLEDQTSLKLELDYKLNAEGGMHFGIRSVNEFMYFDDQKLIGYLGISGFEGTEGPIEVNGMVDPEYRRQGVFTTLYELAMAEWKRRNGGSMLLLCDRNSLSGKKFIERTGSVYHHSEYEMVLVAGPLSTLQTREKEVTLRKATNADAVEICRQNDIYFNSGLEGDFALPEEEEKRGMTAFLAVISEQIIGKVHLHLEANTDRGTIYGLGILPEYRGKGYGRAVLLMANEQLKKMNIGEITLQVAVENANALGLYKSCGFKERSTMDYYEVVHLRP